MHRYPRARALAPLFALALMVALALACGSTPTAGVPTATKDSGPGPAPTTTSGGTAATATPVASAARLKIGDTGKLGDVSIKLNDVVDIKPDEFNKPKGKFIGVDVTLTNNGTAAANISSMLNFKLKDADGQEYTEDLGASVASGKKAPDGAIAPGDKVRGVVAFDVPTATVVKDCRFYYSEMIGSDQVVFDLTR